MQLYLANVIRQRRLIGDLAVRDFKNRYSGSLLGFFWAFVPPLLTILMYLFIYRVGFKPIALGRTPFVLWLIVGITPWFFFADAIVSATASLLEYSYLVKKVVFDVTLIPAIKIISAALTHLVVLGIVMLIVGASGFMPSAHWLQVPYYVFATAVLLVGLSLMLAALTPFIRDLAQAVGVGIQFFFWLTPIAWSITNAPPRVLGILKLNPIHYIVDGMRDSLLGDVWFWHKPTETLAFWVFAIVTNLLGFALFQRLRPHFADVL
jgi:ABC-type polysaccharide/polyol phosphate export permease